MKRCPTCKRSFDDDTLSFCLEDGTPLIVESGVRADSQETLVSPRGPGLPTQPYSQLPGNATAGASSYQPPGSQYGGAGRSRKAWPWVAGIAAILLIIVVAIVVVAFMVPGLLRPSENGNRPVPSPSRPDWVTPTPVPSPTSDVPTDAAQVLAQLTRLEEEWTEANFKGDKEALERILADDYVGNDDESRTKRRYIDSLKPDDTVTDWELSDLTVDQTGNRAVVRGKLTQERDDETETYDFVDTFVWRDHRWQAVASRATRVK